MKIEDLRTVNYKLIETKTNQWYNLAEDTEIEVEWDKETQATIQNELKKGQVRIIKVDKDNNQLRLEGVEFEVLDENNNVLEILNGIKDTIVDIRKIDENNNDWNIFA